MCVFQAGFDYLKPTEMMTGKRIIHDSLLQIDCSQKRAVLFTQTADSKQPSMSSFGAEKYIFWQPMAARISISLWQFYGTQMVAIYI